MSPRKLFAAVIFICAIEPSIWSTSAAQISGVQHMDDQSQALEPLLQIRRRIQNFTNSNNYDLNNVIPDYGVNSTGAFKDVQDTMNTAPADWTKSNAFIALIVIAILVCLFGCVYRCIPCAPRII